MAITKDIDGYKIQGTRVSVTWPDRTGRGMTAVTESALANLHEIFLHEERRSLKSVTKNMLQNEDEYRRLRLSALDERIYRYFGEAKVEQSMDKVRAIMTDIDLTPEAAKRRAAIEFKGTIQRVHRFFASIMTECLEKLNQTERYVLAALQPIPRQGQDALIGEMRAAEVRGYIAGLDTGERAQAVLGFGNGAKLEALAAMQDDPRGRDFVSAEILNEARLQAILAQDGQFLLDELEDDRNMLSGAADRMTWVETLLWDGAKLMGMEPEKHHLLWHGMAQSAIDESKKILSF
ncbi:MAG: hypothetical protein EOM37_12470 [Proteobacteria bacterium]|nr:hypothetical protein [Pseudomonadota bacterium]